MRCRADGVQRAVRRRNVLLRDCVGDGQYRNESVAVIYAAAVVVTAAHTVDCKNVHNHSQYARDQTQTYFEAAPKLSLSDFLNRAASHATFVSASAH